MDNAVALVQTYLHMNGYFIVAEYTIIGSGRHGGYRTVTDLDILAFRFSGATRLVPILHGKGDDSAEREEPDPMLGIPADEADIRLLPAETIRSALGGIEIQLFTDELPTSALVRDDANDFGWIIMTLVLALVAVECFMAMSFGHYRRQGGR